MSSIDDLKAKTPAELQALYDATHTDDPPGPRQRLVDLLEDPRDRLIRLHREDIRSRFRHWLHTTTNIHDLAAAHMLLCKGELDEEAFLKAKTMSSPPKSEEWLRTHQTKPASDDAGSLKMEEQIGKHTQ
jgi:hypothetical protein